MSNNIAGNIVVITGASSGLGEATARLLIAELAYEGNGGRNWPIGSSDLGGEDMTADKNKQVMHRFVEFINTANEKLAAELISPDAIFYVPGRPEPMRGPGGYLAIIGMMRGGFPDIQWTLEEMIAEGDKVAARFMMRGTHRGTFFGVEPTGKPIEVQAMNFYRLSGGQFVEERGQPDLLGLLQQIGAVPTR